MKKEKARKLGISAYCFVLLSFVIPVIFIILRMIFRKTASGDAGFHSDADYALMLVQCLLGIVVLHIPSLLARKLHFVLPTSMFYMYLFFLYCAIFLGEVRSFFYLVPHWDVILHGMSSLMTGFFGVMVVTILNKDEHIAMRLSPFFVALFSFSFAVMLGALWEIYEFVFDGLLGLNMQKFMLADGTLLIGHAALHDTMKDVIVDSAGALIASAVGYISLKRNLKWFIPSFTDGRDPGRARRKKRKAAKAGPPAGPEADGETEAPAYAEDRGDGR